MILIDYHLLAILPLLLFSIGIAIRYVSLRKNTGEGEVSESERWQFMYTTLLESIAVAAINGIILAELSGNFAAGTVFILFGVLLGIGILSLMMNGYEDLSEYLMAVMGLLFFYEFIYFLAAGTYARVFGALIIGWQIAVIWYFGIIGAAVGIFIFIVFLRMRSSQED